MLSWGFCRFLPLSDRMGTTKKGQRKPAKLPFPLFRQSVFFQQDCFEEKLQGFCQKRKLSTTLSQKKKRNKIGLTTSRNKKM